VKVVRRTVRTKSRRTPDRGYHHTDLRILLPRLRPRLRGSCPRRGDANLLEVQEHFTRPKVLASHGSYVGHSRYGDAGGEAPWSAPGCGADACTARVRVEPRRSL